LYFCGLKNIISVIRQPVTDFIRVENQVFANERGDIVIRHVVKIILIVVLVIFILSELGPIIWYRFTTMNEAEDIANAIAFEYRNSKDIQKALNTASQEMIIRNYSEEEIRNSIVQFLPEGNVPKEKLRLTIVKFANTLFTKHIKPLKRFARVTTTREVSLTEAIP